MMKKLLHNKSFYLVLALLVVIAALLVISGLIDFTPKTLPEIPVTAAPVATATPAPEATAMPEETAVPTETAPEATEAPAETATEVVEEVPLGYILVQANGDGGWIPLPTTDEPLLVTITREDDPTISNTIRLWQTGFQMDSSTCDNQDCVQQGEVTLMNKDERVLMQYVLCLPHNISIELYSTEEILMMIEQAQAAQ